MGTDRGEFDAIAKSDLDVIIGPYVTLGMVVAVVLVVFAFPKFPRAPASDGSSLDLKGTLGRLLQRPVYVWGVVAQAFYVGAQIMCWTFIIQYAGATMGMRRGITSSPW